MRPIVQDFNATVTPSHLATGSWNSNIQEGELMSQKPYDIEALHYAVRNRFGIGDLGPPIFRRSRNLSRVFNIELTWIIVCVYCGFPRNINQDFPCLPMDRERKGGLVFIKLLCWNRISRKCRSGLF